MKKLIALFVGLAAASAGAHAATMFKCVEKSGKVSYSDRPCASSADEAWTSRPGARRRTAPAPADQPRPEELARLKRAAATPASSSAPSRLAVKPGARGTTAVRAGGKPARENEVIDSLRHQEMARITAQQNQAPAGGAAAGEGLRAQCAQELDTRSCP